MKTKEWEISSAGLEHYLDKVGVTGSNPVFLTKHPFLGVFLFYCIGWLGNDSRTLYNSYAEVTVICSSKKNNLSLREQIELYE